MYCAFKNPTKFFKVYYVNWDTDSSISSHTQFFSSTDDFVKAETCGCLKRIGLLLLYTQRDEPFRSIFFFVGGEKLRAM
jgi:hypothetical protein